MFPGVPDSETDMVSWDLEPRTAVRAMASSNVAVSRHKLGVSLETKHFIIRTQCGYSHILLLRSKANWQVCARRKNINALGQVYSIFLEKIKTERKKKSVLNKQGARGSVVVETLWYKPEGCEFDSR
jgi:hypothetical protein